VVPTYENVFGIILKAHSKGGHAKGIVLLCSLNSIYETLNTVLCNYSFLYYWLLNSVIFSLIFYRCVENEVHDQQ
jgi:hypothetical protein